MWAEITSRWNKGTSHLTRDGYYITMDYFGFNRGTPQSKVYLNILKIMCIFLLIASREFNMNRTI